MARQTRSRESETFVFMFGHCSPSQLSLFLPSSSERFIELHHALILVAAGLSQSEFSVIQRTLSVQNFQICGDTAGVTLERRVLPLLKVFDRDLLLHAYFVKFVIPDQRVRDIPEGSLNG